MTAAGSIPALSKYFFSPRVYKVLGKSFYPSDQRLFGVSSLIHQLRLTLGVLPETISCLKKHYLGKIDPEINPIGRDPEMYKRKNVTYRF